MQITKKLELSQFWDKIDVQCRVSCNRRDREQVTPDCSIAREIGHFPGQRHAAVEGHVSLHPGDDGEVQATASRQLLPYAHTLF